MRLFLAGPKAGKTVTLNGLRFISGMAEIDVTNAPLIHYFGKYYGAYLEGSDELARALRETGGGEIYYGKRGIPENPTGTQSTTQPNGPRPEASSPANQSTDNGPDTSNKGSGSAGNGHSDSGVSVEAAVVKACMELDPVNPSMWTNSGRPKLPAILQKLGDNDLQITREQINEFGLDRKEVADRMSH
jgi:hypothetical protein